MSWHQQRIAWIHAALEGDEPNWEGSDPPGAYYVFNGLSNEDQIKVYRGLNKADRAKLEDNLDRTTGDRARMYQAIQQAKAGAGSTPAKDQAGDWWREQAEELHWAIRCNKFVNYEPEKDEKSQTSSRGAYWILSNHNQAARRRLMTFLDAESLDALLRHSEETGPIPGADVIVGYAQEERAKRPKNTRTASIDEGTPGNRPNLVTGDRGPAVKLLQRLLGIPDDGYFGPITRKAVDAFQKKQDWAPSGVGPDTWKALDSLAAAKSEEPPNELNQARAEAGAPGLVAAGGLALGAGRFVPNASGPGSGVFRIVARGTVTVANDVIPGATAVAQPAAAGEVAGGLGLVGSAAVVVIGAIVVAGAIYFAVKLASESTDLGEFGGTLPPGGAPAQPQTVPQAPPQTRRWPNQTCDDTRLDQLQAIKDQICSQVGGVSCSPRKTSPKRLAKIPCSEIRTRIKNFRDCLQARQDIQDECFGGQPDPRHVDQMNQLRSGLAHCTALEAVNCAPGHPMEPL